MKVCRDLLLETLKCLELMNRDLKYITHYEELIWCKLVPMLLKKLVKDIDERIVANIAFDLKMLIESVVQATYLLLKHKFNEVSIRSELSRRTKTAATFTAKMITELPNTPGPIKRQILNMYLKVSEYTHPTLKLLERAHLLLNTQSREDIEKEVIEITKGVIDIVMYLYLRLYRKQIPLIALSIVNNLSYNYSLSRTFKYLSK